MTEQSDDVQIMFLMTARKAMTFIAACSESLKRSTYSRSSSGDSIKVSSSSSDSIGKSTGASGSAASKSMTTSAGLPGCGSPEPKGATKGNRMYDS